MTNEQFAFLLALKFYARGVLDGTAAAQKMFAEMFSKPLEPEQKDKKEG